MVWEKDLIPSSDERYDLGHCADVVKDRRETGGRRMAGGARKNQPLVIEIAA